MNHWKYVTVMTLLSLFGMSSSFGQSKHERIHQFRLNVDKLKLDLVNAPDLHDLSRRSTAPVLSVPMPDGEMKAFEMYRTHPMHPELEAKFSNILSYQGKCMDDGVSVISLTVISLTVSDQKLSAFILDDEFQRIYIEPNHEEHADAFISLYEPKELNPSEFCSFKGKRSSKHEKDNSRQPTRSAVASVVNNPHALGDKLRTHRLALTCTGQYADQQGGTIPSVMAAFVSNTNAINLVYKRELAIEFELVPNTDQLIFLDSLTDPFVNSGFPNGDPITDLDSAHATIVNIIGVNSFDIGHLMQNPTTCPGCGGWAGVGVVCDGSLKGYGMSVQSIPVLIHEIGHQFNCHHTTDYVPTRVEHNIIGNTIMGSHHAPGPNNYFHITSADSIGRFVKDPGYCVPGTNTNNSIPVVNAGSGGMYIPKSTPFVLSGSATDDDINTTLLYNWQQCNFGETYNIINNRVHPQGDVAIFRNYFPTTDGNVRTIPRLVDVINNETPYNVIGDTMDLEGLPSYGRNLTFRLVARDFELTGGAFDYDELSFEVAGNAGPFLVTQPNSSAVTWNAGNNATITWDVANTNNLPVDCAVVDIRLSLDGGYNYPITIASGTANDGSYTFSIPPGLPQSSTARVRIECTEYDNVRFFDISDENFTINSSCHSASAFITPAEEISAEVGSIDLDLNPTAIFGLVNSTTTFEVDGSGAQVYFALWNETETACEVGCCQNYYSTREFEVDQAGTYSFGVSFDGNTGFMSVHEGSFNPTSVCQGFLTSNWLATSMGIDPVMPFEADLVPETTYTLVFHPWFGEPTATGTAQVLSVDGGSVVYLNQGTTAPNPPGDYSYTYVAVNELNNQIVAVESDADFQNLPVGTYQILGMSYKSANPPPAIVDPTTFLNMTVEQAIGSNQCLVLSVNSIDVEVISDCPTTLFVPAVISTGIYQSGGSVLSNGIVQDGAYVIFKAENQIDLQADFEVELGSEFEAAIENCGP